MGKERYDRQLDIVDKKEIDFDIHLLGAGGIGSWTALALAKIGCPNIFVYDNDDVEDHNIASQFFKETQLGKKKVDALQENVLEQTGIKINTTTDTKKENSIPRGVVIIAIDSMKRRVELGELYKDKDIYVIDGRMGGLQLEIYCCHASDYLKTTVDPDKVSHELCTAKAISFNCMVIGGLITNYVRLLSKKQIKNSELTFGFNNVEFVKSLI